MLGPRERWSCLTGWFPLAGFAEERFAGFGLIWTAELEMKAELEVEAGADRSPD